MSDQHAGMISAFDSVFANCPSVKRIPCFYHLTNKLTPSVIWELKQILTCDHREAYTAMIDCFRRERPALYEKYEKTIQAMSYMSNRSLVYLRLFLTRQSKALMQPYYHFDRESHWSSLKDSLNSPRGNWLHRQSNSRKTQYIVNLART